LGNKKAGPGTLYPNPRAIDSRRWNTGLSTEWCDIWRKN
jgi:hypothetical protein